eukprot:TRINITY_DN49746_c0_g1_i1.p1 TRINITY_DN49746_c0_g1~~TRINITY_DN49746_c0_g1_i1.p1  ORF type:complete len:1156 (-),score=159.99 TRINITY_DN49746_c0_g1_i1:64-3531(-)
MGEGLCEFRLVLPAAALEAQTRAAATDARTSDVLAPRLLGLDAPLPSWAAATCGGCLRLRIRSAPRLQKASAWASPGSNGDEDTNVAESPCRIDYSCHFPVLPLRLQVCLDCVVAEGDCTETNALQGPRTFLEQRTVRRIEVATECGGSTPGAVAAGTSEGASVGCGGPVVTVYCTVTANILPRGVFGLLALPLSRAVGHRRLEALALEACHDLLERHWRGVVVRWASAAATSGGTFSGGAEGSAGGAGATATSAGPIGAGVPVSPSGHAGATFDGHSLAAGGGSIAPPVVPASASPQPLDFGELDQDVVTDSVETDIMRADSRPSLASVPMEPTKSGVPLFNGFLYKLNDGYLNTGSWSLRYFLLIGSSLQYFRNPHEAKPRDSFNLTGATVSRVRDQNRPFTFTIEKMNEGQRRLCCSADNETIANQWVARIEFASRMTPQASEALIESAPGNRSKKILHGCSLASAPLLESGFPPTSVETEAVSAAARADEAAESALQFCAQALRETVASGCGGSGVSSGNKSFLGAPQRLRELRSGLRILRREPVSHGPVPTAAGQSALLLAVFFLMAALLALPAPSCERWLPQLPAPFVTSRVLTFLLGMLVLAMRIVRSLRGDVPVVSASVRVDGVTSDNVRELLSDPALYPEWQTDHLDAKVLSISPTRDEILHTRFRLGCPGGLLGISAQFKTRRRWIRGSDGVRFLCSVADPCDEGGNGVKGFEGFAVLPCDDSGARGSGSSVVVWLCALDLVPWAPQSFREYVAVCRVGMLVGLREWLSSGAAATAADPSDSKSFGVGSGGGGGGTATFSGNAPGSASRAVLTAHAVGAAAASASSGVGAARDVPVSATASQSITLLRGHRRFVEGGLHAPADLERAAMASQLLISLGTNLFLAGNREVAVHSLPHGLLLPSGCGVDIARRFATRFAFAPTFLPVAAGAERAEDRLAFVAAFLVASLHLMATTYPYFPWVQWVPGATSYSSTLFDESRLRVDAKAPDGDDSFQRRSASFEVVGRAGLGFRISGCDDVSCSVEPFGALRFVDRSVVSVELGPSSNAVNFTMPELRVRPCSALTCFGKGTVYEWVGTAHVVDVIGNVQCDLSFGPNGSDDGAADVVSGFVRDSLGQELGRIRGSWLGALFFNNEVIWRGPRLQPATA